MNNEKPLLVGERELIEHSTNLMQTIDDNTH
jgi:hypothetical protein